MDKVLLVSALYKFKSKIDFSLYIERANDLISNTSVDMVVFTEAPTVELLNKRHNVKIIVLEIDQWESNNFATPEEFNSMIPLFQDAFFVRHREIDPAMIKMYMEKHIFVNKVIDMFPNYKYYIWNDIGVKIKPIRLFKKYLSTYPDIGKIDSLNIGDKLCFQMRRYPFDEEKNNTFQLEDICDASIIGGGIIIGNKIAWRTFKILYRKTLEYFKLNNIFWGNDETLYFHILMKYPKYATALYTISPVVGIGIIHDNIRYYGFFGAYILLSKDSTYKVTLFDNPDRVVGRAKRITWGEGNDYYDVTDLINRLPTNKVILLDYSLFPYDPAKGKFKSLFFEYEDGRVDELKEYDLFSIR